MALGPITQTLFTFPDGTPIALGYLTIHINKDCQSPAGQVGQKKKIKVSLDANGVPVSGPLFWPNSDLMPSNTVYIMEVFNEAGLRVCGPIPVYVGASSGNLGFGDSFGQSFGS